MVACMEGKLKLEHTQLYFYVKEDFGLLFATDQQTFGITTAVVPKQNKKIGHQSPI